MDTRVTCPHQVFWFREKENGRPWPTARWNQHILNMNTSPCNGIPIIIIKIGWWCYRLIFIMGIPILLRQNLYIEMVPSWIVLLMRSANEWRRYIVTSSLIGWVHTQNDPCSLESVALWFHLHSCHVLPTCALNSLRTGGRFKKAYELLNLRALKISMLYKNHIFQCMGKIFCVEFQRYPLKFHTKYLTHTLKDVDFIHNWKFKSSYI